FLEEFQSFAGKEQRALFGETVQSPNVEKAIEWRKVLHALLDTRDAQGISGKAWFDIATKRINLIYAVERNIGEHAIKAANRLAEEIASDQRNLIVIDTILIIIAAAIGIFVGVRITRGLNAITSDINTLSSGRFDFEVAMQDRTDEFGAIAKSLEGFRKNAEEHVALEEKTQNLQKKAEHERSSMLTDLTASFEQSIGMTVQSLTSNCSQLANVSKSPGKKSELGGNRSLAVAEATITTSQEVDTVAQTGSELSSTIQEISARVAETTSTMRAVVHDVDDAATRIETLQMASQEIGSVVQLINDIAGQTNLLALNATIEAARAGDAGKGFAVVAAEVKNLSVQTENATSKISEQIRNVQEQTGVAVSSIRGIEESIRTADEAVAAIAAAVEEQSATASQISSTMQIISGEAQTATEEISAVCQSAAVSAGAAIEVMWSVDDLYQLRDNLRTGADDFVSELRRGTTA
ncbi:MAG: methyl-accepting chemotaxis protein, partial [Pseudomonadota bacterium]|nr:methyl-accepting chemotaxis protein [Pseudomonadota bacterium]